jgi:hypothetical protein
MATLKQTGKDMDALYPFYDKLAERIYIPFIGKSAFIWKLALSILLGLCFLGLRYLSVMQSGNVAHYLFGDWSWFLTLLITTVMLSLYYATHVFRNMISEVLRRIPDDVREGDILKPISKILTNRGFIIFGVGFGVFTCILGLAFGLPDYKGFACGCGLPVNIWFADSTLLFGFFLAGFVNGMAVFGILVVLKSFKIFSDKIDSSIDFTFPDRCGGTAFLGTALTVYSSVTLIAGVMISVYTLNIPWKNQGKDWIIMAESLWIALPYVMALVVLMIPALGINKILRSYKIWSEGELQKKLVTLQNEIENPETDPTTRKEKQDIYNYHSERRKNLYNMRTWPFSASANAKFLSVISINICTTVAGSYKWVIDNLHGIF